MIRRTSGHSLAQRRGATVVESAVVYPVTFLLFLGLIVGGMGVFRYQEMASLAREAARFAAVHGGKYAKENPSLPTVNKAYLTSNIVAAKAVSLNVSTVQVQVFLNTSNGTFDWDNTAATNNRWPTSTVINAQNTYVPMTNSVTVTVSYPWVPELYLVGPINLTSTSTMPMSY